MRRSDLSAEGIRRQRRGKGFSYEFDGGAVKDAEVLDRIKALVIPPAWRQVWICPDPAGHIQAIGIDAAGRKQYLYHARWRDRRDAQKFAHMLEVARALPRLRRRVEADLETSGLAKERVLAAATRMLDSAALRIGGESYAQDDPVLGDATFGLATLRREHVTVNGSRIGFSFLGKGAAPLEFEVEDQVLAEVLKQLLRREGSHPRLLVYRSDSGWRDVRGEHVNWYLRENSNMDMTAKDFRTWYGTVCAAICLAGCEPANGVTQQRRNIAQAMRETAQMLGNTASIARKSYVDGRVVELYSNGVTITPGEATDWHRAERAVLKLLQ